MLSDLALQGQLAGPWLLSGFSASLPALTPWVAPKPSSREEVIPSSLGLCSATWLSHSGGEPLGGGFRVAPRGGGGWGGLTLSLPTAVCGGTSWPADAAPRWPGWHGGLCRAHDHRTGITSELPLCGGELAGVGTELTGASDPKVPTSAPAWPSALEAGVADLPSSALDPLIFCPELAPPCTELSHHSTPAADPKFPLPVSCFAQC